jgi:hypothetical protein
LPWLKANCPDIPERTARHYKALARKRAKLCDENGNVLPLSVRKALEVLMPQREARGGEWSDEDELSEAPSSCGWRKLPFGEEFGRGLAGIIGLLNSKSPHPRYVVKAALKGNTPGLTAAALREAGALMNRYADAFEREGL